MVYRVIRMRVRLADGTYVWRWYAKAVVMGRSTTIMIAEKIAEINTLTPTDVLAVIDAYRREITERLRMGHIVEDGDLGNFQLVIENNGGSATKEEWAPSLIKRARVQWHATKSMKAIAEGVSFTRWVNLEEEAILNHAEEMEQKVHELEVQIKATEHLYKTFAHDVELHPEDTHKALVATSVKAQLDMYRDQLELARAEATVAAAAVQQLEEQLGHELSQNDEDNTDIDTGPDTPTPTKPNKQ